MYKNHRIDITSAVIRPSNTSATTPTIQHKDSQLSESNHGVSIFTSIHDFAKTHKNSTTSTRHAVANTKYNQYFHQAF